MENELEKVLESKFFCPARSAQEIETLVHGENNMSYIDAIIYFCEKNSIDLDSVSPGGLLTESSLDLDKIDIHRDVLCHFLARL